MTYDPKLIDLQEAVSMLTNAQRAQALETAIAGYVRKGFIVQSRSEFSAQLIKHKKFSLFWALFWLIMAVLPFFIYLLYYLAKKDQSVYLYVDEYGRVTTK